MISWKDVHDMLKSKKKENNKPNLKLHYSHSTPIIHRGIGFSLFFFCSRYPFITLELYNHNFFFTVNNSDCQEMVA